LDISGVAARSAATPMGHDPLGGQIPEGSVPLTLSPSHLLTYHHQKQQLIINN